MFRRTICKSGYQDGGKTIVGKIPRTIIYNKDLGEKRVLFYLYIYFAVSRSRELIIIINEAIKSIGYRPDTHKGKINDEFASFISWLVDGGYIKVIRKHKGYTKYQALQKMDEAPFGIIRYDEYQKIIKSASNKTAALLLLAFLRLNSYKRTDKNDKQPEVYFCHLSELPNKLGLSSRAVSSSLNALSSLGLIHSEEQRRYRDKYGNWHSGVYLFIDKVKYNNEEIDQSYNWQKEFELASKWLMREQAKYND